MFKLRFLACILLLVGLMSCSSDEPGGGTVPDVKHTIQYMKLEPNHCNQMTCKVSTTNEYEYEITTEGTDPYIFVEALKANLPEDSCVLTFQYKSDQTTTNTQIFFGNQFTEERSVVTAGFSQTSSWQTFKLIIKNERSKFAWGGKGSILRLDFGGTSGVNLHVRNLYVRGMTAAEKKEWDEEQQRAQSNAAMAANVKKYLETTYASHITDVNVTSDKVSITGTVSGSGTFALAEVMPHEDVTEMTSFENQTAISDNTFTVTLDRTASRKEGSYTYQYDRVLSRWAIVQKTAAGDVLASHARYADEVTAKSSPAAMTLKNKKGLGSYSSSYGHDTYDIEAFDVGSVTVDIVVDELISTSAYSSDEVYRYNGITYHIDKQKILSYDNTIRTCTSKGIAVLSIILFRPSTTPAVMRDVFRDPEYTSEGRFSVPNITTLRSVNALAAITEYLAQRYNGGNYGRINHWIMLNEVDCGKEWANMGEQPEMRYMDRYVKVMRLYYNIVRQYDQNASILGSYTHLWTKTGDGEGYAPKNMLEQTQKYCEVEGDFWWGAAMHPYPQDLSAPSFWNDDKQSTFSLNSQYVTFKNLEVYDAFFKQKSLAYKGGTKRLVFLSENGTNSPDYSDEQLALQAAGACWAWKKVAGIDGIDAIQWHGKQDFREEFGLRLGLRYFADDETFKGAEKPAWFVWRAAGTSDEDAVFAPYLNIIGISDWNSIFHTVQ